jgi:hypothetical protein
MEIKQALEGASDRGFVVAYMIQSDLYVSDLFDTYEAALAYTTSEEGAGESKAIIIAAGVISGKLVMVTEDHT